MSTERMDWLRHPLVSMVLGFVLTGVIGTTITQHFLDRREQERLRAQSTIDTRHAIQQFATLNEARKVRGEFLLIAIRGVSTEEAIAAARAEYESAVVNWSVERPGTLLLIRELLDRESYDLFRRHYSESLEGKIFKPIRACLTSALLQRRDPAVVKRTLDGCAIDELLVLSSNCSLAMAATVSDLAGTRSDWVGTEEKALLRQQAKSSIAKHCP